MEFLRSLGEEEEKKNFPYLTYWNGYKTFDRFQSTVFTV